MSKDLARKERDRQRREEDFLHAAERLFGERGFHGTTMEAVAEAAEYATGTTYRYFASKEDLYQEIVARKGRVFFRDLERAEEGLTQPFERLRARIGAELDFYDRNRSFMQVYHNELQTTDHAQLSRLPEDVRELYAAYMQDWRELLTDGMETGVFRRMDVTLALAALRGTVREAVATWMHEDFAGGRGEVQTFLCGFLTTGLIVQTEG